MNVVIDTDVKTFLVIMFVFMLTNASRVIQNVLKGLLVSTPRAVSTVLILTNVNSSHINSKLVQHVTTLSGPLFAKTLTNVLLVLTTVLRKEANAQTITVVGNVPVSPDTMVMELPVPTITNISEKITDTFAVSMPQETISPKTSNVTVMTRGGHMAYGKNLVQIRNAKPYRYISGPGQNLYGICTDKIFFFITDDGFTDLKNTVVEGAVQVCSNIINCWFRRRRFWLHLLM